jgi:uncharacterized protein YecE (DUF72 family)
MADVYIGTMGWSYKFWVGNFYPENTPPNRFLAQYSKYFNTVEVDSTFYRIPPENTIENWKEQTPEGFLFSVKFPRIMTHLKMLKNCEQETEFFIKRISHLGDKLGVLLLQLPTNFSLKISDRLLAFLDIVPKTYHYAVEIRNKQLLNEELISILTRLKVALVMVDHPAIPTIETVTSNFIYIRWKGDRVKINPTLSKIQKDRTLDTERWAKRIAQFASHKISVFGYFSKYYSGHPPTDVGQLLRFFRQNV